MALELATACGLGASCKARKRREKKKSEAKAKKSREKKRLTWSNPTFISQGMSLAVGICGRNRGSCGRRRDI